MNEFKGKLIHAYPVSEGTSANGNTWKRRTIVLEDSYADRNGNTYTDCLALDIWGDAVENYKPLLTKDAMLVAQFYVTSRESTKTPGQWFTSARVRVLETLEAYNARTAAMPSHAIMQASVQSVQSTATLIPASQVSLPAQAPEAQAADGDDLPF